MTDHDIGGTTPRRGFLRRLAAAAAMVGGSVALPAPLAAAALSDVADDDWMKALTGKHRTVFDLGAHRNGRPLMQSKNYLDAWRDAFKVPEDQVNLVVGVQGEGIPIVLSDALWSRFHIGQHFELTDAATKAPATRNLFIASNVATAGLVNAEQSVEALQKRGVRFVACRNALGATAARLSALGLGPVEEVRAALLADLLPGVITVPAMVVALAQLQERGLTYVKIS